LAGVQNGIYGVGFLQDKLGNITDSAATDLLYTSAFQVRRCQFMSLDGLQMTLIYDVMLCFF